MYRFKARVDDGIRVFVDGRILIDQWGDNPGTEFTADRFLKAGNHTVKVEYYQRGYDAFILFWWEKQ